MESTPLLAIPEGDGGPESRRGAPARLLAGGGKKCPGGSRARGVGRAGEVASP